VTDLDLDFRRRVVQYVALNVPDRVRVLTLNRPGPADVKSQLDPDVTLTVTPREYNTEFDDYITMSNLGNAIMATVLKAIGSNLAISNSKVEIIVGISHDMSYSPISKLLTFRLGVTGYSKKVTVAGAMSSEEEA
jgi:hypothetical protein